VGSSDDAERSKPDPDIVNAAIALSGLEAPDLVMIGDTPYDVEAATRAGVRIVGVRSGGWDDASLAGAIAVYQDVGALLAEYEKSIFQVGKS
jgi:phosphoglycolate phosphatase-like HAD superfamily hydrolase